MKEEFGIGIEILTNQFNQKINAMINRTTMFAKKAKENFTTGLYMDSSQAEKELQKLESRIEKLKNSKNNTVKLASGEEIPIQDQIIKLMSRVSVLKQDLEAVNNSKMGKLGQAVGFVKNKIDGAKNAMSSLKQASNHDFSSSLKKGISSVKRFALALFSVRSAFSVISRASSAYLSQDQELSNKIQAAWIGLGAMFESVLSGMANGLLKLVGYINVFVKSLTGVDYLAKAMDKAKKKTDSSAKAIRKARKEAKALKGDLAGFDEINNIADKESPIETPEADWTDQFKNQKLDLEWFDKITNFGKFIKDNWQLIVIGLAAVTLGLKGFALGGKLASMGIGGLTHVFVGIGIAIAGVVGFVMGIIELFKKGGNESKAWTLILGGLALIVIGIGIAFGVWPMVIALIVAAVTAAILFIIKHWNEIKIAVENFPKFLKEKFGVIGEIISVPFENAINLIKGLFKGAMQFFEGVKDFFQGIFTLDSKKIIGGLKLMLIGIGNILIAFIEGALNSFLLPINMAIKLINKIPGVKIPELKVKIPCIPKLNVGTNYVESDGLAEIHKGEAVVPKEFNSKEFFGRGNEETNMLLRELIRTIEDKDMNTYLDSRDIGRAARDYNLYNERVMG